MAGLSQAKASDESDRPNESAEPPPLSLATLYHPQKRHNYDGHVAPARWIDGSPPFLVVLRDAGWMRVDLATGDETPWGVTDRLAQRIEQLDGVDEEQARSAAARLATQLQAPDQANLIAIGDSLAVVDVDGPAKLLTRDADSWGNATLDPTETRVAYTDDGDLFLVDVASGRTLRLTDDASETLLDGVLDWTYQEEIFGRGNFKGFWFSPDGQWLAMLRIDISQIEPYVLTGAAAERGTAEVSRYSKAGDPIPEAELLLWDLRHLGAGELPPPRVIQHWIPQQERIITGVWWHQYSGRLMYTITDRPQTWRELRYVDDAFLAGEATEPKPWLREESPGWVDPPHDPRPLPDGGIVWQSELPTGRSRLYHIDAAGRTVVPLSPPGFDVHDFFVDDELTRAIVTGDTDGLTSECHAYRLELPGGGSELADGESDVADSLQPITTRPGWYDVQISPDGRAVLSAHSTASTPPVVRVLPTAEDTFDPLQLDAAELELPGGLIEPELLRITTEDGVSLPAMVVRPPSASPQSPCPLVIEVYGGPQAPTVANRWGGRRTLYRELLARRGIGTLVVDNRSSGGRGILDSWSIHHRMGEVELKDLLSAVSWLKSQSWVDAERLAVRGWSFGGFLSLYAMTHSEAFVAGIAGGSVTDWHEYDSFYTERFMGLPKENPEGYAATSPLKAADQMHGRVLMIHGELDDNVHPANTLRMARALQQAGKVFELMIYPGAAHSVHDPWQVWHMAQLTDSFLIDELIHRKPAR